MTTHRHIATPYELAAANKGRLNAIIVPLVPEPSIENGVWDFWTKNVLLYRVGDELYLVERWCLLPFAGGNERFQCWVTTLESEVECPGNYDWQPADTMPIDGIRYWFDIKGVRVLRAADVGLDTVSHAGMGGEDFLDGQKGAWHDFWGAAKQNWNTAYPDQPWDADRWVVVLTVEWRNGQS